MRSIPREVEMNKYPVQAFSQPPTGTCALRDTTDELSFVLRPSRHDGVGVFSTHGIRRGGPVSVSFPARHRVLYRQRTSRTGVSLISSAGGLASMAETGITYPTISAAWRSGGTSIILRIRTHTMTRYLTILPVAISRQAKRLPWIIRRFGFEESPDSINNLCFGSFPGEGKVGRVQIGVRPPARDEDHTRDLPGLWIFPFTFYLSPSRFSVPGKSSAG
jgi:hypothetical protein